MQCHFSFVRLTKIKKVITITPSAIESIGEGVFVLCWCVTLVRLHISPRWCDGPTNQGCPKWSLRWLCTWRIWKVGSEWDNPSGFSSLCWTYPCHQQADIENAETPVVFAQHIGISTGHAWWPHSRTHHLQGVTSCWDPHSQCPCHS